MSSASTVAVCVFVVMAMVSVSAVSQESLAADVYVGWGEPELIETGSWGPAEDPQVAMDESGNAVAVWSQSDGTRYDIWANRYVVGTGWGVAELIEANDLGDAISPRVAIHGSGNATATWTQWDGAFYDIWANQYVVGTGWGTPELVETEDDSYSSGSRVVIDRSGNVTIVWARSYVLLDPAEDLMMNRYVDGSWGTPRELDQVDGAVGYSDLAVDDNGNVTVVWTQYVGYAHRVYYARYYPSSDWSYPYLLSDLNAESSGNPSVAFDGSGSGIAVWQGGDISCPNITSRRYVIGSGWSPLEPLETFDDYAVMPQMAMDDAGNAIVVWKQTGVLPGITHIFSNRYVVGVGWGTAEPVEDVPGQASNPSVATDGSGNAIAVWQEYDGSVMSIFTARYVVDEGWGESELLETANAGVAQHPKVVMDLSGNAIAVWQQDDGTRDNVYSNRYAVPDVTPPVLSLDSPEDGYSTGTPAVTVSGETEPGADLVVNGLSVAVGPDGSFSCEVALVSGANVITATATDASGNQASASVSVIYVDPSLALEDQLSDLQEELAALLEELDSLTGELNGTSDDLAALEEELGSVTDELNGTSDQLAALEDELDLVKDDLSGVEDDLDGAMSQITLLMVALALVGALAVMMLALYIGLRRKAAGGEGGASGEEPPGPEDR